MYLDQYFPCLGSKATFKLGDDHFFVISNRSISVLVLSSLSGTGIIRVHPSLQAGVIR